MNGLKIFLFLVKMTTLFLNRVQHKSLTRARVHFFKQITDKMDKLSDPSVDHQNDPPCNEYALATIIELAKESKSEFNELTQWVLKVFSREPDAPVWLNNYEAMRLLNISASTLKRLRQRKLISYIKVNGYCRYHIDELMKIVESQKLPENPAIA